MSINSDNRTSNRERPVQESFLVEMEKNHSKRNSDRKNVEKTQSIPKVNEDKNKPLDKTTSDKKSFLTNNDSTLPNQSKLKFSSWDTDVHEHSLHSILEERLTKHRKKDISGDLRNITNKVDRLLLKAVNENR